MSENKPYFFCGIGGSGMLALATLLRARGHSVAGSDRALDQGRTPAKFDFLRARGIGLFPQDGSGIVSENQIVVASAAVEERVPDIRAARAVGAELVPRAELLAAIFNAARTSVAVGGTSGKSTTTAMIGWILHAAGRAPTVVNGAVMKNFASAANPFASAVPGAGEIFVCETDESDGSIARFRPTVAVLTNIALDHKSMDELRHLFRDFVGTAGRVVINRDNGETAALAAGLSTDIATTFSLADAAADLNARDVEPAPDRIAFTVVETSSGAEARIEIDVPGRHNAANALAAIGAARALDIPLGDAAAALGGFTGIRRRFEIVGRANGVTVIDDFAHNPDKIAATLAALRAFPGRVLVLFQPHGFGPLRLMKDGFIDAFAKGMNEGDVLVMPEPVYFGGTVGDRSVTSADIAAGVSAGGREAYAIPDRTDCADRILDLAAPGDRIVVMGARDDTLSELAADLVKRLAA